MCIFPPAPLLASASFSCCGVFIHLFFSSQEKEQELEQLTKELRQVNLQQFIQQTGTKVTVLPAQPTGENNNGTYTRTQTRTQSHAQRLYGFSHYHHLVKKLSFIASHILIEALSHIVCACICTQCPLVLTPRMTDWVRAAEARLLCHNSLSL